MAEDSGADTDGPGVLLEAVIGGAGALLVLIFVYTYELHDKTLSIWFGGKGSPAFMRGEWSRDRNTLTGAWQWREGATS